MGHLKRIGTTSFTRKVSLNGALSADEEGGVKVMALGGGTINSRKGTEELLGSIISIRSLGVEDFFEENKSQWPIPITSINEDKLLTEIGVAPDQRKEIEGLVPARTTVGKSMSALAGLAYDPPEKVGHAQRCTTARLARLHPLGLRFSGSNMSPLPGWLSGGQCVALNFCTGLDVDLGMQLHYALFDRTGGYVLKPKEMRSSELRTEPNGSAVAVPDTALRWPPIRNRVWKTSVEILSLHNLPKRGERRPQKGNDCHNYVPELTSTYAPPDWREPHSQTSVTVSLHPIGGFCATTNVLPPPAEVVTSITTEPVSSTGGLNVYFGGSESHTVHCLAAEPDETFIKISVADGGKEVMYHHKVAHTCPRALAISAITTNLLLSLLSDHPLWRPVHISFDTSAPPPSPDCLRDGGARPPPPRLPRLSATNARVWHAHQPLLFAGQDQVRLRA